MEVVCSANIPDTVRSRGLCTCQHSCPAAAKFTVLLHLQVDIEFHGVFYAITILVHAEDVLTVEIEDKDTLDRWRGEFAAQCKQL